MGIKTGITGDLIIKSAVVDFHTNEVACEGTIFTEAGGALDVKFKVALTADIKHTLEGALIRAGLRDTEINQIPSRPVDLREGKRGRRGRRSQPIETPIGAPTT